MNKTLSIQIADPSGNITIFVRTPVERRYYQQVAEQLLMEEDYGAEQVAFILPPSSASQNVSAGDPGVDGSMEMCGLEFCGNASRAFALMLARETGCSGRVTKKIRVSGCADPLTVELDMEKSRAKIRMPDPLSCEVQGDRTVVDLGGILHIITESPKLPGQTEEEVQTAMEQIFGKIRSEVYRKMNPPALGVMFWDSTEKKLTPVVYVKDVETIYFEGSCGSGTTACAAAFSMGKPDGVYEWSVPQPAGIIDVTAEVKDGRAQAIYIDSQVKLGEIMTTEVEIEDEE
ncbi:MAG: hypothetical protein MRZ97_05785 [Firmicutes bacterium]|nr:hypothetical protein [Bacillota bacterium]